MTWGLRPKMMAQVPLNKIHRIACLCVIGAIKMCSTPGLTVLTPLHLFVKTDVAMRTLDYQMYFNLKKRNNNSSRVLLFTVPGNNYTEGFITVVHRWAQNEVQQLCQGSKMLYLCEKLRNFSSGGPRRRVLSQIMVP